MPAVYVRLLAYAWGEPVAARACLLGEIFTPARAGALGLVHELAPAGELLDQPVAAYTADQHLDDGQSLRLGDADWQVVRTPGHTPGHLSLRQPDERLLVVGDALSDYDVGWVNLALDGPDAAAAALASLHRLARLNPRVVLPAHGPIPADPGAAFATALRRAQRLADDPAGAVWYAARRIFAFALMIRDGLPGYEVEPYLHARVADTSSEYKTYGG